MSINATIAFWLAAFVSSGLLGWKAVEIFTDVPNKAIQPPKSWWWYQRFFNFFGSLVGWLALWFLVRRFGSCVFCECNTEPNLWDLLGGLIAFIGVTGYLPTTIVGFISSIYLVGIKFAESLKDLLPKPPEKGGG